MSEWFRRFTFSGGFVVLLSDKCCQVFRGNKCLLLKEGSFLVYESTAESILTQYLQSLKGGK